MRTILAFIPLALMVLLAPCHAQDETAMRAKCTVSVSYTLRGEDAHVTVTVKNGTKKTLVDPVVRVRFLDKDGNEVTTDAKGYAARIKPGASKKLETRIWRMVSADAAKATGAVEYCVFE
jgi:hypothetical protein